MAFNSALFGVFLLAVLTLHRLAAPRWRAAVLLGASAIFYAMWIPRYLGLLAATILLNYALLRAIARSRWPRLALAASVCATLGVLAYHKYAAFAADAVRPLVEGVGLELVGPEVVLPLGISFYSFQIVALAVDTYRRLLEPVGSLSRYALFVGFFPQLVAGPIVRGRELLPQLARGGELKAARTRRGLRLLASGLAKKVVLADFLLAPFVDAVFELPGSGSGPYHLVALYSFAFQIYFDFSGYTDIARGVACLLGYELPANFLEPYLSRNPAEFWRRWHVTLSSWLRDYLYIPLGGNRGGRWRTVRNLGVTMLLGGLWHGAAWNFVVWGGLHGLLLIGHRVFGRGWSGDALRLRDLPRILLCFHATCLLWVFFRAATLGDAWTYLGALVEWQRPQDWPVLQVFAVALCGLLHPTERWLRTRLAAWREQLDRPLGIGCEAALLGATAALVLAAAGSGGAFIYFQF